MQRRCQPLMASLDLLAALDTSLSRAGRTNGACLQSDVLSAKGARQFSSLPQFTSSGGGPVFTGGQWPIERVQANAFNHQASASSSSASASDRSSWSDPDEKAESFLDQVQQAALSHVVGTESAESEKLLPGQWLVGRIASSKYTHLRLSQSFV